MHLTTVHPNIPWFSRRPPVTDSPELCCVPLEPGALEEAARKT